MDARSFFIAHGDFIILLTMKEKINMDGCIVTRCYPCVSLGMFDFLYGAGVGDRFM